MKKIFAISNKHEKLLWWVITKFLSKPIFIWSTFFLIISLGAALSVAGYTTAFQRSGAVCVAFAISLVFFNHIISDELNVARNFISNYQSLDTKENIRSFISKQIDFPEWKMNEITDSITDTLDSAKEETPLYDDVSRHTSLAEFVVGFSGTLVWGFGDIPFAAPCCIA